MYETLPGWKEVILFGKCALGGAWLHWLSCRIFHPAISSDMQSQDISKVRKWEDLPQKARDYVMRVDQLTGVKSVWIGVGPGRDAIVIQP